MEDNSSIFMKYISLNLERISNNFASFFKSEYGITPLQMSVVWYLRDNDGMSMGDMANKMNISKQQMTKIAELLVVKGIIYRSYSEQNRRLIFIKLTDKGQEIVDVVSKVYSDNFNIQCSSLNESEYIELIKAMNIIIDILPKLDLASHRYK